MSTPARDAVVLLHGLGGNRLLMTPLARALAAEYETVVNWGYFSLLSPLRRHAQRLARLFEQLDERGVGRIHLVTHSMGGIITRLALEQHQPRQMGRFVMIAPPNHGSHVATRFAPWLGRICRPLVELADGDGSLVRNLSLPIGKEIGVIAARTDILVQRASTHLACELDHIVLPGWHTSLLFHRQTIHQTRHFLQHGRFARSADRAQAA